MNPDRLCAVGLLVTLLLSVPAAAAQRGGDRGAAASAAASEPAAKPPHPRAGMVDINNDSLETLMQLEGIDRERAQAIVKGRPYDSPRDLLNNRILSANAFDKIKSRLVALKPPGG